MRRCLAARLLALALGIAAFGAGRAEAQAPASEIPARQAAAPSPAQAPAVAALTEAAQPGTEAPAAAPAGRWLIVRDASDRLLVAGAGAILGALFFNMATAYFGGLPFVMAPVAPVAADFLLGSRILAGLTAGGGALAGHYLYVLFHQ